MDERSVIVKALEIDAKKLSVNPDKFIKANEFQYTLALHTWLDCIRRQCSEEAEVAVCFEVIRQGLVATIQDAVSASNMLIRDQEHASLSAVWCWVCAKPNFRSALQILRYLKRFTPIGCDMLDAGCIQAYIATLNRNAQRDRTEACRYITTRAKDVLKKIFRHLSFGTEMPNGVPSLFFEKGYFSPGVTHDASPNCLGNKVLAWVSPFFGDILYPNVVCDHRRYSTYWSHFMFKVAKACVVPKSFKAKRIIAEEESERQFYMQGMRTIVREYIAKSRVAKNLELDRQESQQRRCFDTRWATLDLTSASDTITVSLACDILPPILFNAAQPLRAFWVEVNGKHMLNTIYQTSGSAWCFDAESLIFFAVCTACQEWKATFTGEEYLPVYVYGDDIEVDSRCFTECMEWLTRLGFIVNEDKSFGPDTLYRESCGVEVWDGWEVSTSYWPRKEIRRNKDSLESLIALNTHLINVGWTSCHLYVLDAIREIAGDKFTTTNVLDEGYATDALSVVTPIVKAVSAARAYTRGTQVPDYEGHMSVSHVTTRPILLTSEEKEALRMFYYSQFLIHGPRFLSDIDRLLGCSTDFVSRDDTRVDIRCALEIRPRV